MLRERSSPGVRSTTLSVDIVVVSPQGGTLGVLLAKGPEARPRDRWILPWDAPRGEESLADAATRLARAAVGRPPNAVEQICAFGDTRRHPADAEVSVGYYVLIPESERATTDSPLTWFPGAAPPTLAPRQRLILDAGLHAVRRRLYQAPLAFHLLPSTFTLSELQGVYETVLGRPLHKASFRRALRAAHLVEPTEEWRSEGRGRPAQLFRYDPKRRLDARRGLRFDLLED